ncbi:MAG: carbonic anhydrase [Pirellulaceae bacterium]
MSDNAPQCESKLFDGVRDFQHNIQPDLQPMFDGLANGQSPKALFITCSDSRIDPNLLTGTEPGELFVVRNAGNIIPDPAAQTDGAHCAIEYAVLALSVPEIIICGHAKCGAMGAALDPDSVSQFPFIADWVALTDTSVELCDDDPLKSLVLANVKDQIRIVSEIPFVAERMQAGELSVHGWYYDFVTGAVEVLDHASGEFSALI